MFDDPTNYGYLGIIVFLILTGCGLPLPEEVAIIAAGVTAGRGTLNPWLALGSCVVGAIVGDSAMYWIGRLFGKGILEHHPFWAKVFNAQREQQIEGLLKKHGAKMLLLVRFLPGLRSPVYFAAGVLRANYLRFLITDTVCAVLVVSLFFGLTYYYGSQILAQIHDVELLIVIGVVIALVIIGVLFWVHRRSKKMMESPTNDEAVAAGPLEQSPAKPSPEKQSTEKKSPEKQSPTEHVPEQNSDGHQPTEQHPPPVSVEKQ